MSTDETAFLVGHYSYRRVFVKLAAIDIELARKFFHEVMALAAIKEPRLRCCDSESPLACVVPTIWDTTWNVNWVEGDISPFGYCTAHLLEDTTYGRKARRAVRSFQRNMNGLLVEAEKVMPMMTKQTTG